MVHTAKKTSSKTSASKATKSESKKKTVVKAVSKINKVSVQKTAKKKPAAKAIVKKQETKEKTVKKIAIKKPEIKEKAVKKIVVKKQETKIASVEKESVSETPAPIKKDEFLKKLRMTKTDQKYFRELLLHARAQFGQQVKFHSEDALSTHKDSAGERAGMATHMADLGTDNYRHDYELQLMSEEVDVLEMIDEALQRIEDSEYGVCLDCGEQIPRKRLEAKPYARYCTKCKSIREQMDEDAHRR